MQTYQVEILNPKVNRLLKDLAELNLINLSDSGITKSEKRPKFGSVSGFYKMSEDFDEPLEDFKEYM